MRLTSFEPATFELVPLQRHREAVRSATARVAELEELGTRLGSAPDAAERLSHGVRELEAQPDLPTEVLLRLLRLRIRLRRHHEAAEAALLARLLADGGSGSTTSSTEGSLEGRESQLAANAVDLLTGEIAAVYRVSRRGAARRIAASAAAGRLPLLRGLHAAGEVDQSHVRVAAEATLSLRSDEATAAVDAALAARAPRLSVGETRLLAQRAVLEADPELAAEASQAVEQSADVQVLTHDGGSGADLVATGSLTEVAELMAAIETRAGLCQHEREVGAAGRARFDALLALVRGGLEATLACSACGQVIADMERGSRRRRARTRVLVTVPYETLTGEADLPAMLDRYGPISARAARRAVCREGSELQRLRYDPSTGIAGDLDARRYRLSAQEADLLAARDGVCTAPGCARPASTCDADHRLEVAGGGVSSWSNLQSLCRPNHDDKTQHGWVAEPAECGGTRWVSPHGLVHETDAVDHRPLLSHPPSDQPGPGPSPGPSSPDDPDPPF